MHFGKRLKIYLFEKNMVFWETKITKNTAPILYFSKNLDFHNNQIKVC